MPAREKLNAAYFSGSFFIAGLVGWITGSWLLFAFVFAILVAINLYVGEIRPGKHDG